VSEIARADHSFDEAALARYLRDKLPGFDRPIAVSRFEGGQSNPTYKIDTAAGPYVLRKKPAGRLLPSAHAIEREFAVMAALNGRVPVPRMHLLSEDEGVIGQPFYVMEYVAGRIMPDARLLDAPRRERRDMTLELVRVLARLHSLDYRAIGLETFGRPEGYVGRQLARWTRQYASSRIEDNPDMDRLIPWLETNLPPHDEACIVHGDYRSYNVIFAPDAPRVTAVLDWELATLGHPLAELAYFCLPYHLPADDPRGFHGERPEGLGIPSEQEATDAYLRESGRAALPHWRYFLVFSLFRSAAIRAGVYARAFDGTAASAHALEAGRSYRSAAAGAWRLVEGRSAK
jgi:aminoglycoside phosphotransferase (APT) family kinase protein